MRRLDKFDPTTFDERQSLSGQLDFQIEGNRGAATNGTLAVSQKDATVTADNKTKIYGQDNPPLTATVSPEM